MTDTDDLRDRLARALWDYDNAMMSKSWRDTAWDDTTSEHR